jgi:putative component of membrane protein insertase Oxa1/YidC/SpoIIIJ protein YidD
MKRCILLMICLLTGSGCAAAKPNPHPDGPAAARTVFFLYEDVLGHLSSVRSGQCPMYPSCSEYSREAFGKHGMVVGWWMTFDRLLRCGRSGMKHSPRILIEGTWKHYDPVARNDRWWYPPPDALESRRPPF